MATAIIGGGCFWCTEAVFTNIPGITSVTAGYAGGAVDNPSYEDVSSGRTGHAEVIKLEFNEGEVSYRDILIHFFASHDPTTLNRQGVDVGTQYRSVIFVLDDEQKKIAEDLIEVLTKEGVFEEKIVTKVEPLANFYTAEEYHQKYFFRNKQAPYCEIIIAPKLETHEKKFRDLKEKVG